MFDDDQKLIEQLKLADAPADVQENTLNQVRFTVVSRVAGILEGIMDDEQFAYYQSISGNSPEEVWRWLNDTFVNTHELVEAALQDYLKETDDLLQDIL